MGVHFPEELTLALSREITRATLNGSYKEVQKAIRRGGLCNDRDRAGQTPLHHATWQNYPKIAELLLQNGAEVNAQDDTGDTPLHLAGRHGRKEIAKLLICQGADKLIKNNMEETAAEVAYKRFHCDLLTILCDECKRPGG